MNKLNSAIKDYETAKKQYIKWSNFYLRLFPFMPKLPESMLR
jgi:hypothetical protein